ncbi:MAG: BamA/TamA family outer membrane protein [Prevotella sp.]|nr:BamA/TamA family outer membrane protein [Prevotella sp.]
MSQTVIHIIRRIISSASLRHGFSPRGEAPGAGSWVELGVALLLFASCSTTKNIPDDDQLFTGLTKIEYKNYEPGAHFTATQEELEAALATAPNGALFGSSYYRTPFPYRLWIWNAFSQSESKFGQWVGSAFGKPPVLMSNVNPALRASVARSVLRKNGYLHGSVSYQEVPQKNPKKMKIGYTVSLDTLFTVDTMSYERFPRPMMALIDSTRSEAAIGQGSPFTVANLDAERTRLSRLFRNNGYFYYQPGYASYLADTFDIANRAKLRLQLADSLPAETLRPWYMGNVRVQLRRSFMEQPTDSIGRRFLKVFYSGKRSPIRPRVILRDMKLRPRQLFSYDAYQESLQKLNATGVFSSVDLQLTPRASSDTFDMTLACTFDKPYDFYVEANFINRTIGRLGPELKVGFTKRNAFRGAEKIDVNLHGAYEWQTSGRGSDMNSYQYGVDAAIEFPRIVAPFIVHERPRRTRSGQRRRPRRFFTTPWTIAKVSSDVVRRPSYYKMHIVSGEWTYRWQPSASSRHELSPLTLKYQYMNSHTTKFDSLLNFNPYLQTTMSDYFIPKMRYTYTYASPATKLNPLRWETTIEESGNLTALYDLVIQGNGWHKQGKTLFKNPYSQFVRIETDLTKTWTLDAKTQLVGHVNAGIIYSYGNSTEAPFSESFYVGGANSIRAFTVRSIGPGSCKGIPGNRQFSYIMQNGDSKLVMNLELRRRLFGGLYGALFLDAGNVWSSADWLLTQDEGQDRDFVDTWNSYFSNIDLHASRFFRELATGTGIGLRYDLDFLVLRVDWGFGLHLPYDTGKSGYFNIPRFKDMHALHIAIGYPF